MSDGLTGLRPRPGNSLGAQAKSSRALSHAPVSRLDRWLAGKLLEGVGRPAIRMMLWNGESISASAGSPVAGFSIRNRRALYSLLVNPELHFGSAYCRGDIQIEGDPVELIEACYGGLARRKNGIHAQWLSWINRARPNTPGESLHNIHHHYDIGNDFYRLWLDEGMQYTCAYYTSPTATLEEAQLAKQRHVCRKLDLKPGETVIEAGCGWGGLARFMARHYGVRVRAYNISHEQVEYARERARAEGLDGQVEYVEEDFRCITGRCDAFVSVGMLEHAGRENYAELGRVIHRSLKGEGRGLVHSIGRNRPESLNAWIERNIFPGAYPPTLREMMDIFEPWELSVLDVENLRLHYARTLGDWLDRYEAAGEQIAGMFDEHFVRSWRFYLAGSMAAFTSGEMQLFQVLFAPGKSNDVPWTRAYLYSD